MDAKRYFAEMHKAMGPQMAGMELLLTVQVQDCAGADAYLELGCSPDRRVCRVSYSTMGRRAIDFQLFRRGWQTCHNEAGEMTGQFPSSAKNLIEDTDFHAFVRSDPLDAGRAGRILCELQRRSGTYYDAALPRDIHSGAVITVDSMLGRGAHWRYWSGDCCGCLPIAAILCWLADVLAGSERQLLQSHPQASALAARWDAELRSADPPPVDLRPHTAARPSAAARSRPHSGRAAQNDRWQSILAVLSTV
ncbi:MAG: hypothetical protein ACI4JC_05370 [Faecalibacterium sp.]